MDGDSFEGGRFCVFRGRKHAKARVVLERCVSFQRTDHKDTLNMVFVNFNCRKRTQGTQKERCIEKMATVLVSEGSLGNSGDFQPGSENGEGD